MKSTTRKGAKNNLKFALLLLPLLLLTFCQNIEEDIVFLKGATLTKDSKVVSLMIDAVKNNSDQTFAKSHSDDQCTEIAYPMSFEVYHGDNPVPTVTTINSDEELIDFLSLLSTDTSFYIYFPITLIDVDGVETIIYSLEEFEGTLQMLVDACHGNDDGDSDDDDDDSDDDGDSDDDDSDGDDDSDDDDSDDDDDDSDDDDSDDDDDDSDDDDYDYCHNNNKKVYICHKGQTICVSINAIWGHLNQHEEDFLGKCE